MRPGFVIVFLACGCGGTTQTAPPAKPAQPVANQVPTTVAPPPTTAGMTPEHVCDRMAELHTQKCNKFADLDLGADCAQQFQEMLASPDNHASMQLFGECVTELQTCADVVACVDAMSAPQQTRRCDTKDEATLGQPVGETRDSFKKISTHNAHKYSEIKSTKDHPVEVCGIPTENDWLTTLTCEDGTHPVKNNGEAEMTRVGNLGPGGRCNSIIDLYRVKCPEASYDIYLDGYVCPAAEQARADSK
ncbi:MAG TPA: hypothetical protein VLX92_34685 [Kofleriaceae bacterium]|nr:hypothetical protein [Kofleriaceae bacterium]